MEHVISRDRTTSARTALEVQPDWARVMAGTVLQPGERLQVTKFVAYGWSSMRSLPALRDQVEASLTAVSRTGWDQLVADQRAALDEFWAGADVEVEGDLDRPAGRSVRVVPHVPGGEPSREAGHRRRRGSPARAMTGTRSGTPRASCCRC